MPWKQPNNRTFSYCVLVPVDPLRSFLLCTVVKSPFVTARLTGCYPPCAHSQTRPMSIRDYCRGQRSQKNLSGVSLLYSAAGNTPAISWMMNFKHTSDVKRMPLLNHWPRNKNLCDEHYGGSHNSGEHRRGLHPYAYGSVRCVKQGSRDTHTLFLEEKKAAKARHRSTV